MKLPEIVQNIKTILYNNRIPNSIRLDDRQIIYWINQQRALWLIKEDRVRMKAIKDNEKQTLKSVELDVNTSDLETIFYNDNWSYLRSIKQIPKTIQTDIGDGIIAIRGKDVGLERYNYCNREEVIYKGNGIFNKDKIFSFIHNGYIWVKYAKNNDRVAIPKYLQIEGVFENPLDVDIFNEEDDNIKLGITDYPVSMTFILYIETEILKINIQRFVPDEQANDEEDTVRIN